MDHDETLKTCYLVMDNASIHKLKPVTRRIKIRDCRATYLPSELNTREQIWKQENEMTSLTDRKKYAV